MKLSEKLENISTYPFHMPGHKRNGKYHITGAEIDITEIDGFDNLHCPQNMIADMQRDISERFGYKKSIISVNGSTCGILAAICGVCDKGDKIIIARNCHKSVYNACFLQELDVVYLEPEFNEELRVYTRISQDCVDAVLKNNADAKAIVITSPTYEGFISNIHCEIPLIVDCAHGAHFGFADWLPERENGDIVIQSLHKTLPCLTQCAVVHINNEKYFSKVKMYMDIFESSSPSYVLMNSIDKCIDFLKHDRNEFDSYKKILDDFYLKVKKLNHITIYKNDDLTRLVISAKGYSGVELSEHLRHNGIEAEGATLGYVILISTVADTQEGFDILYSALEKLEKREDTQNTFIKKISLPAKKYKSSEIDSTVETELIDSVNKISGEYVFAYPPGVPIIVPGEVITQEVTDNILLCIKKGVNIISESNLLPNRILTKTQQ